MEKKVLNGAERKGAIIRILNEKQSVHVDELTELFGVSKVTIRNDLEDMQQKGLIVRTHGGAMLPERHGLARTIAKTMREAEPEKIAICEEAIKIVEPGQAIIIDSGSTTVHMAKLCIGKNLAVATNSLFVAQELMGEESVELIMIGGVLRRNSMGMIGSMSRSCLSLFHADWYFMGASGFDLEKGVTCSNMAEAETKCGMIQSAEHVCLLADSSKLGKVSFAGICGWDSVDVLITNKIEENARKAIEAHGVRVLEVVA